MSKYEKIMPIPSVSLSPGTIEVIDDLLEELAEERVTAILADYALNYYRQPAERALPGAIPPAPGMTEEEFVTSVSLNEQYRSFIRLGSGARYTYLSPHGNIQFVGEDFAEQDVPKDLDVVIAEANGATERLISLNIKARTQPVDFADPNLNRILIQSSLSDRAWVNDIYDRLSHLAAAEKNFLRDLVYRYMPVFVWVSFFALVWLEYRFAHRLWGFSWDDPLHGLQLLSIFFLLAVDLLGVGFFFLRMLPFAHPYFELEGNLSRRRIAWRWPVNVTLSALYGFAIVTLVKALFW